MKLFCFLILTPFVTFAQKVEKADFDKMLHKLLDFTVKTIDVAAIDSIHPYVFLDAREKKEFDVSHIQNAIWCGYDDFDLKRVKQLDKNTKIVVYCSVGYRSEKVSEKLIKAKFTDVQNLYGGIFEWKNAGRLLYSNDKLVTEEVFAYSKEWGKWLRKGIKVY